MRRHTNSLVSKLIKYSAQSIKFNTLHKDILNPSSAVVIPFPQFSSTRNVSYLSQQYFDPLKFLKDNRLYSVNKLSQVETVDYRKEHNITVYGENVPSPCIDIDNSTFPDEINDFLKKQGFVKPTVIQSQAWPVALSGKNFVGIAQTGTGKTLGFLLPAIVHIKKNEERRSKAPKVLVLAPTRELARQIEVVAKDFRKLMNIRTLCVYGGASRIIQMNELRNGVDLLIATPGRLNDFLMSKDISLSECTYVVLDEADRMLDMGFEPQIRRALESIPQERQILMFSATWPEEIQDLAKEYLGEYIQVNVGSTELSANHNIEQHLLVCKEEEKMEKFRDILDNKLNQDNKVLVFANTKILVDDLTLTLRRKRWSAQGIHGGKTQAQRESILRRFRTGDINVLVATDVAARGLDVDGVTHVINYDFPNTTEDYIHRIGRTGRNENKGVAYTLITDEDGAQAKKLIAVLEEANQEIPEELQSMANNYRSSKNAKTKPWMQRHNSNWQYKPRNSNRNWNSNKNWNGYRSRDEGDYY